MNTATVNPNSLTSGYSVSRLGERIHFKTLTGSQRYWFLSSIGVDGLVNHTHS